MGALRVPLATYRLQFNRQFGFHQARALVPYLDQLGITDLYASPLVQARRGSPHGYDVTDPSRLNPELGTEKKFHQLAGALRRRRMGLLLDIVPNHMAASSENPWWFDVLENGPGSLYAGFFDIDCWTHSPVGEPSDRVVLPVLGEPLEEALAKQTLTLALEERGFVVRYYQARFPLSLRSYCGLFNDRLPGWKREAGEGRPTVRELGRLLHAMAEVPRSVADARARRKRHRAKELLKARLWRCYRSHPEVRRVVDTALQGVNQKNRNSQGFFRRLLDEQFYELAYWRTGAARINYRRFFDVSDLVSLSIDNPEVFAARHELLFRLVKQKRVTGVRVDHIDGLLDPLGYLVKLQASLAGRDQASRKRSRFYVVVEKILALDESLPPNWPVEGTTGYDFLNTLNAVLVDSEGSRALRKDYSRFVDSQADFADIVYAKKKQVMESLFPGEMRSLLVQLRRLAAESQKARRCTTTELDAALLEVTACLRVYRTYARGFKLSAQDRQVIRRAVQEAQRRNPRLPPQALAFLQSLLLLQPGKVTVKEKKTRLEFVKRWQQLTGPIMAKGFEDTALYNYHPLSSLSEVGGDPATPGLSLPEFHARLQARCKQWPHTMNATATHDSKRGEDVRARINVLSEMPKAWGEHLERWSRWNREKKHEVNGLLVPDPNQELLLYQTLLGIWPLDDSTSGLRERIQAYMVKAAREAKVHTRWRDVNSEHEGALETFVASILEDNRFLPDFLRLQEKVAFYGALNSLSQLLIKIAAPGVPDFYQGAELWNFRLVDPDNRRPIDFRQRTQALEYLQAQDQRNPAGTAEALLSGWKNGRVKLYTTWKGLNFRRAHRRLFLEGDYLPLYASGRKRANVLAFARRRKREWALVVVPRLVSRLSVPGRFPLGKDVWGTSVLRLPRGAPVEWQNVLTGERLRAKSRDGVKVLLLSELFGRFPVALAQPLH